MPVALVLLGLLLAACPSAKGALIDRGLTTFDSDTGLSWLDLTETYGLSHDEVSDLLLDGNRLEGYRFAAEQEVRQLFQNAGIVGIANGSNGFNFEPARALVNLLGTPTTTSARVAGVTDYEVREGFGLSALELSVSFDEQDQTGTTGTALTQSTASSFSSTGHYLVSAIQVPSPAGLNLLLAGLLSLSTRRCVRQRGC